MGSKAFVVEKQICLLSSGIAVCFEHPSTSLIEAAHCWLMIKHTNQLKVLAYALLSQSQTEDAHL